MSASFQHRAAPRWYRRPETFAAILGGALFLCFVTAFVSPNWARQLKEFQTLAVGFAAICSALIAYAAASLNVRESQRREEREQRDRNLGYLIRLENSLYELERAVVDRIAAIDGHAGAIEQGDRLEPLSAPPELNEDDLRAAPAASAVKILTLSRQIPAYNSRIELLKARLRQEANFDSWEHRADYRASQVVALKELLSDMRTALSQARIPVCDDLDRVLGVPVSRRE
jgi:hypothetical protein